MSNRVIHVIFEMGITFMENFSERIFNAYLSRIMINNILLLFCNETLIFMYIYIKFGVAVI